MQSAFVVAFIFFFFFFNDTATTEIYTLFPTRRSSDRHRAPCSSREPHCPPGLPSDGEDRKSTRLNSSNGSISYAVFCLKKKNSIHIPLHDYQDTVFYDYIRMNSDIT